jgi:hypothetical protein
LSKLELNYNPVDRVIDIPESKALIVIPKKEFKKFAKEVYGPEASIKGTTMDTADGRVVAILPQGVSTSTRLHELAHILKEHTNTHKPLNFIEGELQADAYACTRMQKGLGGNHILRAARSAGSTYLNYSPDQIANYTVEALQNLSSSIGPEYLEYIREKVRESVTRDRKKKVV